MTIEDLITTTYPKVKKLPNHIKYTGATSVIIKHKKKKMITGYTIDPAKFKLLELQNVKFKLLGKRPATYKNTNGKKKTIIVYKYTMLSCYNPSGNESSYINTFFLGYVWEIKRDRDYIIKNLKHIKPFTNKEFRMLIDKILLAYNKNDRLDLHKNQFMVTRNNRIIMLEATHDYLYYNDIIEKLSKIKIEDQK